MNSVEFALKNGDRLCAAGDLWDIHELEDITLPAHLWFFRQSETSPYSGLSQIFNVPGVYDRGIDEATINIFVDCVLHTLDLGVAVRWGALALKTTLEQDIYETNLPTKDDVMNAGLLLLKGDLNQHYKDVKEEHPERSLTKVSRLTIGMLGTDANSFLHTKGGETRCLVPFIVKTLVKYRDRLGRKGEWKIILTLSPRTTDVWKLRSRKN